MVDSCSSGASVWLVVRRRLTEELVVGARRDQGYRRAHLRNSSPRWQHLASRICPAREGSAGASEAHYR